MGRVAAGNRFDFLLHPPTRMMDLFLNLLVDCFGDFRRSILPPEGFRTEHEIRFHSGAVRICAFRSARHKNRKRSQVGFSTQHALLQRDWKSRSAGNVLLRVLVKGHSW